MAIVPQDRFNVRYFWNGLSFFNMPKISNKHLLNWDIFNSTDTGGMMYKYVNATEDLNSYNIKHLWSLNWNKEKSPSSLNPILYDYLENDPRNINGNFFSELFDNTFLHYRAGGNWDKISENEHILRTNLLFNTLCKLVKE